MTNVIPVSPNKNEGQLVGKMLGVGVIDKEDDDEMLKNLFGDDDDRQDRKENSEDEDAKSGQSQDEGRSDEEAVKARKATTPEQPTQKQIDDHELTHFPFRSWCVHCQRGKMSKTPHRSRPEGDDEHGHPVISIDYMYLEVDFKKKMKAAYHHATEGKRPILVVVDSKSKATFSHDMDAKGADQITIEQIEEDIRNMGYQAVTIVIKGDQEPSIVAIQEKIINNRKEGKTIPENSPVGESSSNGMVERAIRSVQGQIRTIKDQVETKTGRRIERGSTIFKWIVEWAAATITRYRINSNGKTAMAEIKGRQGRSQIAGFGEKVLYVPLKSSKANTAKIEMRAEFGIFLNINMRTEEIILGTPQGTVKARSIKRMAPKERWDVERLHAIKGDPRRPVPGVEDRHIPVRIHLDGKPTPKEDEDIEHDPEKEEEEVTRTETRPRDESKIRRMVIRKVDVEAYGPSPQCPGCKTVESGRKGGNVVHSEECRNRMMKAMEQNDEGKQRLKQDEERRERRAEKIIEQEAMKIPSIKEAEETHNQELEDIRRGTKKRKSHDEAKIPLDKSPIRSGMDIPDKDSDDESRCPRDSDDEMIDKEEHEPVENKDRTMIEVEEEELQEAPGEGTDIRVEIPREAARKRRSEDDGNEKGSKWQSFEVDVLMWLAKPDIMEVYSPKRVNEMAEEFGLKPGLSLDLTNQDENGDAWDFNTVEMRNKAIRKIHEEQPMFVVGSPMCDPWSIAQNANKGKWTQEETRERMDRARVHLDFMCRIYKIQAKAKRYYIHEHPAGASSWKEESIISTMRETKAYHAIAHMCRYGMTTMENGKEKLVRKATRFMTNSKIAAEHLGKRCFNEGSPMKDHDHGQLVGHKTKKAQVYPPELCRTICRAIKAQKEEDKERSRVITIVEVGRDGDQKKVKELMNLARAPPMEEDVPVKRCKSHEWYTTTVGEMLEEAWDDVTGEELDPEEVKKARAEEIEFFRNRRVYRKVPIEQCVKRTGKHPIKVRWVDINKGDKRRPKYRSRLVAKDIKRNARPDLYAATPPLEALKAVLAVAAKGGKTGGLMVNDVKRAYFYAPAVREVYVELCEEDRGNGEENMCGLLDFSMYGTRDAAQNWQIEFTKTLLNLGFQRGKSSPCVFHNKTRNIKTFVHGDDYVSAGEKKDIKWLEAELERKYEITTTIIGPENDDEKSVRVLNRLITWRPGKGIEYEADPRHAQILVKELASGKAVSTPATREDHEDENKKMTDVKKKKEQQNVKKEAKDEEVEGTRFRGLAARANFLAADRMDIQYSVKEACRGMANPTKTDWSKLVRIAKYLKHKPRAVQLFPEEGEIDKITIHTDTDWAGCKRTRRSTSGGCITVGGCLVKSWSTTQSLVALSSGEAELYGIVKGSAEGLGMQSLMNDLGMSLALEVKADASAALGVVQRIGLGKLRHIHTNWLWVQDKAQSKTIQYGKVPGSANPADALTKPLDAHTLTEHTRRVNVEYPSDAHEDGYDLGSCVRGGAREEDARTQEKKSHAKNNAEANQKLIDRLCSEHEAHAWQRQDLGTYCLRQSCKTGPKWQDVKCRITVDKESQEMLRIESQEDIRSQVSYHKQWSRPRDTQTTLIYKSEEVTGRGRKEDARSDESIVLTKMFTDQCDIL